MSIISKLIWQCKIDPVKSKENQLGPCLLWVSPPTPTTTSGGLWAPQATGRRVSSCWLQSCLASGTTAKHLIIQHFPILRLQRPHVALLGVLRLLAGLEFACCTHIWSPDGGADPRLPGVHQVAGSLRLWPVCPLSILPVFFTGTRIWWRSSLELLCLSWLLPACSSVFSPLWPIHPTPGYTQVLCWLFWKISTLQQSWEKSAMDSCIVHA